MNKIEYQELIAFHPGYYVKDYIDELGITQEELSKRLQTTPKYVSDLVNGRINLTDEMVLKLSIVFGTSTKLWLNLNRSYIEKKLEVERREKLAQECELVKKMDYKFWVTLGAVKATRIAAEKVQELQKYFKVSSLAVLGQRDFLVQYRTSVTEVKDINVINANAWVQTAINEGKLMNVELFNKKNLTESIPEIRNMTVQKPEVFTREEKRAWLDQLQDVALGSDAFFPFGDNIERAHKSGVKYVAQPGGSVRDDQVIETCNKYGMTMCFTGIRLFHH